MLGSEKDNGRNCSSVPLGTQKDLAKGHYSNDRVSETGTKAMGAMVIL